MIVAESRLGRRVVGRMERGQDLLSAITEVCAARGVRSATFHAFGWIEDAELRELDQKSHTLRPARRYASAFTIVHLAGSLAEEAGRLQPLATCALSRERDNGIEMLGGQLVRARVYAVEFVIDAFDDVVLRRSMNAALGTAILAEAIHLGAPGGPGVAAHAHAQAGDGGHAGERVESHAAPRGMSVLPGGNTGPAEPRWPDMPAAAAAAAAASNDDADEAAASGEPSWSEVARSSSSQPEPARVAADEPPPEEPLRAGDVIEHSRFGRCEVERIEGDADYAQVRLRNNRLIRLSLDVLHLALDGVDERGRRRFRGTVAT